MSDLTAGVPLTDIPTDGLLAGTVGETKVMLARWTDADGTEQVTALASTCTHAGAQLTNGLRTGCLVRCPFHHAAFDLRNGEAVRAPAYEPLQTYPVSVVDGVVTVTDAPADGPPERVENTRRVSAVVVLGGGAAGFGCVEKLRRAGYDGAVTLVTAEPALPLDRTKLSKGYLSGDADASALPLKPAGFYGDVRLATEATAIDTGARTVTLSDGSSLAYDALVIATGAEPTRPDLPGFEQGLVLRTQADADAIIAAATTGTRVVVVGSSFIGLEVAAALRAREVGVTLVGREDVPLANRLGDELGRLVAGVHAENGVEILTGTAASWGEDGLLLEDGRTVPGDVLVLGAGVRPRTALAEAAGLAVADGIVVDEFCETAVRGVFAAGDVASFPWRGDQIRVEHWAQAGRMGALVAVNLLGAAQPLDEPPFFWSKHFSLNIRYAGHAGSVEDARVEGSVQDRKAVVTFMEDGAATAVAGVGSDLAVLQREEALLRP